MAREKSNITEEITNRIRYIVDEKFHGVWTHLARKAGIPSPTFSRYMKGDGTPKMEQFGLIVEVTRVEPRWLLTGEGPIYQDEAKSWSQSLVPGDRQAGYLEAGRIIAALQQRIEQLEDELARIKAGSVAAESEESTV